MIAFLVTHRLIPREQHGFSVQSNLLFCMWDWTKDADAKRPLDIVYLEFSKAFDSNLHRWIYSSLSNRTFRVNWRHCQ